MYVVDEKNIISKKMVEIGVRNNGMIEILNGLVSSDLVVYEGINKINEGSKVKVK